MSPVHPVGVDTIGIKSISDTIDAVGDAVNTVSSVLFSSCNDGFGQHI